jgi:hypothetical protein
LERPAPSFEYHDNYMRMLAQHFNLDLKGKRIADLDQAQLDALPPEPRKYIAPLRADYLAVRGAEIAARPRHVADCLQFAANAWRRPLSEKEKQSLRTFYDKAITTEAQPRQGHSHCRRAFCLACVPHRAEQPSGRRRFPTGTSPAA